eukprot:TRINITY_DN67023_c6_g1_i1.p2 TRINITY_DN67023_c6_g1~~TRINITY_DN67023_c6_g1_i1.p2  ORF type:complete len:551 (-),score=330.55 TRINITY_DN67023_c6_g1_i1:29-1681(-)
MDPSAASLSKAQKGGVERRVALICIDGWGLAADGSKGDATREADTPMMDAFRNGSSSSSSSSGGSNEESKNNNSEFLWAELDASGLAVGLPKGVMGNSEVGHLTIGTGRTQFQDLVRINKAIEDGEFRTNKVLLETFERAKGGNGRVHFLGLVSDGGVHSHIEHLKEFLIAAEEQSVPHVFVHFFADGRDTPPTSGTKYMRELQEFLAQRGDGAAKLATVTGRYYAMDRDKRWERIELAYDGLVSGKGEVLAKPDDLIAAVEKRYEGGENDEFLKPIIVDKDGCIADGDSLVFIDFRADRMRQMVETLGLEPPFDTDVVRKDLLVVQMTQYSSKFVGKMPILYPPQSMDNSLGEWISKHKLPQYHTAETEKYAHVTFFFNGGREEAFEGEDRKMVASPKVATYDLKPDMSMDDVAASMEEALAAGKYPFVMCNLAPTDMVGHTGVWDAAVEATTATDKIIARIWKACEAAGYVLVVTADHGNVEDMLDAQGNPKTSHSTNPVMLAIAGAGDNVKLTRTEGGLCDVAPTILHLMGLDAPAEMTGKSMVQIE